MKSTLFIAVIIIQSFMAHSQEGIVRGSIVDAATGEGFSGPGRDGQVGYAYASPSGSNTIAAIAAGAGLFRTKVSAALPTEGESLPL